MNIRALIRHEAAKAAAAFACLLTLTSCDGLLYDDEGDCSVHYRLKFRYDMTLNGADAFAAEVSSVHLYAFDEQGVLSWEQEEQISPATAEDYTMELDLPAGDYRLVAWCGLRNDGERQESFSVPEVHVGQTRLEELQCSLNRKRGPEGAYSDERLYRLFHGTLDVTLPSDDNGGIYDYTMRLTKDTNHVRVILQHLSGEDVDVSQFTFRLDDVNGLLGHDNVVMDDENITYRPWATQNSEAALGKDDVRSIVYVKGAIADMTVGRMMESHRNRTFLTISNREGSTVARIPLIHYAILGKEYYEKEYKRKMTDQEFLDREDDYVMTFFLDENHQWVSSQIMIHSWIVVTSEVDIES